MSMQRMIIVGLAAALAAGASTAEAQRPRTIELPSRWMFNAHTVAALGTSVRDPLAIQTLKTGPGAGGGVLVGYVLTPRITAFAGVDVARQSSRTAGLTGNFKLSHLELGARMSFPVAGASRVLPYATVSVGRRSLSTNIVDLEGNTGRIGLSGLTVGLGGGAQYFLSPQLALDGGVSVGLGRFGGDITVNGERFPVPKLERSTIARVMFGVNWYH
jgi:hypothetical protein